MSHLHDWAERGAYLFAGVAVVSLSQLAFVMTCISTALAIILALVKLHDRFKYGPSK